MFQSEPYSPGQRIELSETPLAVIMHSDVSLSDLTDVFDASFGALSTAMAAGLFTPTGGAVAVYRGDVSATFDLEVGFPVESRTSVPSSDAADGTEIVLSSTPGGSAYALTHIGSYDGLEGAWAKLVDAAKTQGGELTDVAIEVYVNDPSDTAEEELRTDLILPVRL